MSDYLTMKGVTKTYQAYGREVHALKQVDFSVRKGTVHGLLGENGAGKSTLMKILSGVEQMDSGSIELNGSPAVIGSATDAQKLGIGMVHQHFSLLDDYTVEENIVLGMEPVKALGLGESGLGGRDEYANTVIHDDHAALYHVGNGPLKARRRSRDRNRRVCLCRRGSPDHGNHPRQRRDRRIRRI